MRVAAQLARMSGATGARYRGLTRMERAGPAWTGEVRVRDDLLTWPLFRRQPRRIAVSLMSDLFHEVLTTATIDRVHAVIAVAHWHTFLVLTKRSRRMREYYGDPQTPRRIAEEIDKLAPQIFASGGSRVSRSGCPANSDQHQRHRSRAKAQHNPALDGWVFTSQL
jgi:hypothetical protein